MRLPDLPVYPPQFDGIEILAPEPHRPDETRFRLLPEVSFSSIERIVLELPQGKQLMFYDAEYPSPSDPGSYFSVAHGKGGFIMFCGNHGWSSDWHVLEETSIVRYLWSCRLSNTEPDIGYLQVSDDNGPNRPISEDKGSYFAQNVALRLQAADE